MEVRGGEDHSNTHQLAFGTELQRPKKTAVTPLQKGKNSGVNLLTCDTWVRYVSH